MGTQTSRLRDDLASPDCFPHSLSALPKAVGLVRMTRGSYDAASFLDERILDAKTPLSWYAWEAVTGAVAPNARADARFIWHVGHVGSTLVSRLIGALPGVLSLREPLTLRTLTQIAVDLDLPHAFWTAAEFDDVLDGLLKLWSRTYSPSDCAVVKATSVGCGLAERLLARHPPRRSLGVFTPPAVYLATVFGGENSRVEARHLAQFKLRQLNAAIGGEVRLAGMSEGELIAMSWLAGMAGLLNAAQSESDRWRWLDFDEFLANPAEELAAAAGHLGIAAEQTTIEGVAGGPIVTRYSKAPEHAYTTQLRRDVLRAAQQQHGEEIAKGLAWLQTIAARHKNAARALAVRAG